MARKKAKSGSVYKCGACGELGHNARTCPSKKGSAAGAGASKKAPKKKPKKPRNDPKKVEKVEEVFDYEQKQLELPGIDPPKEEKATEETTEDGVPPPGLKLNTPKRKRERSKAELAFWAASEKKLAPGSVAKAGELVMDLPRISTGNFGLDVALFGGIPQGRIVRFWGSPKSCKTGSCLNTVVTYQRNHCSECFQRKCSCKSRDVPDVVWVDAENRMNSMLYWPKAHGINLDCMHILCPPTGQNIVDFVDHIIREQKVAKVGLIVVDSLAHVVSQDELNKPTMDGVTVGRNAHLLNSAWRKWTSATMSLGIQNERKPTILCINQLRQKVGVIYGCFHEDTPVMFADGSQPRIRDVVEQKLDGPVLSWDGDKIVERRIANWHDNGLLDDGEEWLTFRVRGTGGRRGTMGFTCTPNHILVDAGGNERRADSYRVGDGLVSWYENSLSDYETEIVIGSIIGDGYLAPIDGRDSAASLVLSNSEQSDYLDWKLSQLRSLGFSRVESSGRVAYRSTSSFELGLLRQRFYNKVNTFKNLSSIPAGTISDASPLTLAVWYMDGGHYKASHNNASISVTRLTEEQGIQAASELADRFSSTRSSRSGRKTRVGATDSIYYKNGLIHFTSAAFEEFSRYISEFVHPSMSYKLLPADRVAARGVSGPSNSSTRRVVIPSEIISIHKSSRKMRSRRKYDLTIEGDSFFLVGGDSRGVVVHNSNETMPGGIGQDFATSVDVRFQKGAPTYVVWDSNKRTWLAKQKSGKSTFKPPADATPDFMQVKYRVTNSGFCPPGRSGEFNYWLKSTHGHRCGDPDNGLQLWQYCKRYGLIEQDGHNKTLFGHTARTYDELQDLFRGDVGAQRKAWSILMKQLCK